MVKTILLFLPLLLVGNLSICVQLGGFPSKFPFLTWLYMRCISTCTTYHSNWLTFGEGYIAVLASASQYLVLLCLWPLLQVQMEDFMGDGAEVIVKDWECQHPCGTLKPSTSTTRHSNRQIFFICVKLSATKHNIWYEVAAKLQERNSFWHHYWWL